MTIHDCFETERPWLWRWSLSPAAAADVVNAEGAVPWNRAVALMDGTLKGLRAIHRAELVHRDIKPDNVLLAEDEDGDTLPKITDLGIAHDQEGTRLTRDGSQLGTLEYMAPELFESHAPSIQSDLYACGVMLYELLVGDVPFSGTQAFGMKGHCFDPPDFSRLPADVPAHLRSALETALAKDPAERFADCNAFRAALSGGGAIAPSSSPGGGACAGGGRGIEPAPVPEPAPTPARPTPPQSGRRSRRGTGSGRPSRTPGPNPGDDGCSGPPFWRPGPWQDSSS